MAKVLNDTEIQSLLGKAILNGEKSSIRPNSYVIRLGEQGEFLNSGKEFTLGKRKKGIKIQPGHSVAVTALETIDFRRETVDHLYPNHDLHGIVSPTTDLSREGIVAPTTQIDAGYHGTLNWTITNTSSEERRFLFKERIFRLTIFRLEEGETPEQLYAGDYHEEFGYVRSRRKGAPVGMKESEWEDSMLEGGPEAMLENLIRSGYPWHVLGERLKIIDQQFKSVTNEYADIQDSIERLEREVNEVRRSQSEVSQAVRTILKEEASSLQNRWLIGASSVLAVLLGVVLSVTGNQKALSFVQSNGAVIGLVVIALASIVLIWISRRPRSDEDNRKGGRGG